MSPKELLYVEDALAHEQFSKTQCAECVNRISDPTLKTFINGLIKKHGEIFNEFYNVL